ncbi:MAG: hypothetical protein SF187_28105 [Deltaproteobacteria bacterium]|nr:hypothetical protein [Deltaproteobacteria bacterium]
MAIIFALWSVPLRMEGARPAAAAESGAATELSDTVELVGGGFIRGVVTEYVPKSHVVIRDAQGTLRRLPAKEIAAVRRSDGPSATAASPAATNVNAETSLDRVLMGIAGQRIKLKVSANKEAALERRISVDARAPAGSDTVAYYLVCETPCVAVLPASDPELYRVHNQSAQPSDWFSLPRRDTAVHADLVHQAWTFMPRGLLYTGLVFAGASGVFYGLGEADVTSGWSYSVGAGSAILAGTALVASAVVWIARPKSKLTFVPSG